MYDFMGESRVATVPASRSGWYATPGLALRLGVLLWVLVMGFTLQPVEPAYAQIDTFEFDTDEQQQRFRHLSNELRCPMCQNTSLTGSTGGVAEDLRREIHRMIMEGMSDDEIKQFMFERYGDFIFYRPRFGMDTALVWLGPILFLLIGGYIVLRIVKRSSARQTADTPLSDEEQKRLQRLLDQQ